MSVMDARLPSFLWGPQPRVRAAPLRLGTSRPPSLSLALPSHPLPRLPYFPSPLLCSQLPWARSNPRRQLLVRQWALGGGDRRPAQSKQCRVKERRSDGEEAKCAWYTRALAARWEFMYVHARCWVDLARGPLRSPSCPPLLLLLRVLLEDGFGLSFLVAFRMMPLLPSAYSPAPPGVPDPELPWVSSRCCVRMDFWLAPTLPSLPSPPGATQDLASSSSSGPSIPLPLLFLDQFSWNIGRAFGA